MLPHQQRPSLVCAVRMDRDLSRARAILIGNGTFTDDEKIPRVPASGCVAAMLELLTSDLCDWPRDRISLFEDLPNPADLARSLVRAVREAEALPDTAMPYGSLARILRGSTAATKLVILDCCYAETANQANFGTQSAGLTDAYPVDGLYFIGASKRWEKAGFPLHGDLTYFTKAFIDTVRSGVQGKPPQLTIGQIFVELRARLVRIGLPEPAESGERGAHDWPFARNAAPPATHRDPDQVIAWLLEQNAASEARARVLQTAVADSTAEVERLWKLVEESELRSAAQRQQLDAELRAARARLEAIATAQAAAQTESWQTADSVDVALSIGEVVSTFPDPPSAANRATGRVTRTQPPRGSPYGSRRRDQGCRRAGGLRGCHAIGVDGDAVGSGPTAGLGGRLGGTHDYEHATSQGASQAA
jgi:hypothetical protein